MKLFEQAKKTCQWLENHNHHPEVLLFSKISFFRNINNLDFKLSREKAKIIFDILKRNKNFSDYNFFDLKEFSFHEINYLYERFIPMLDTPCEVIPKQSNNTIPETNIIEKLFLLVHNDQKHSIRINHNNNLIMTYLDKGFNLIENYNRYLSPLEEKLGNIFDYTIHPKYGFLNSNISFLPTGFQIEIFLDLYALKETNSIEQINNSLQTQGFVIKPVLENINTWFSVKNTQCIDKNDTEIINTLNEIIPHIINLELEERATIIENSPNYINEIALSYSKLRFSENLDHREALFCLSLLRIGYFSKVFNKLSLKKINHLLSTSQLFHFIASQNIHIEENTIKSKMAQYTRKGLCS